MKVTCVGRCIFRYYPRPELRHNVWQDINTHLLTGYYVPALSINTRSPTTLS